MAVFLNWKNTIDGSQDRFAIALFNNLSPRWYPINIIGSEIYNYFEMYGGELSSLQTELDQTYSDLSIENVRVTSTGTQTTSKIYDNFGVYMGATKLFNQYFDIFSTGSVLQSYRQELRVLSQAFLEGASVEGVSKIGYAYTGVGPLFTQSLKSDYRWRLTNRTGSVVYVGPDFIITNPSIYPFGSYIPVPPNTFSTGSNVIVSYSKLGTNTKLRDKQSAYSMMEMIFYTGTNNTGSTGFISAITNSLQHVLKADQSVRITLSDNFVYYRPQLSTSSVQVTDTLALSSTGYLYNSSPTSGTGSSFTGTILQLPPNYKNFDWFLDWMIVKANDAYPVLEVRSYPSQSIPDTVYFKRYDTDLLPLLIPPDLTKQGTQYLFSSTGSVLYDISGHNNNLSLIYYDTPPQYKISRDERRLGLTFGSGSTIYATGTSPELNFPGMFSAKAWISGIDKTASGSLHSFTVKRLNPISNVGYDFGIDIDNQVMFIDIINGATTRASSSIYNLLLEEPSRPHYFGYTYAGSKAYFYLDNLMLGSSSVGVLLPSVPAPASVSITVLGGGLGIDELVWGQDFLTPMEVEDDFANTKPRYFRLGIPSGSVDPFYQTKVTLFASGSHEIEFHQFNMRASNRKYYSSKDLSYISPYVLPIWALH